MDIEEQYEGLTRKLKKAVPFKALSIRELVQELRKNRNTAISLKTKLTVIDVYNSGDINGIVCKTEPDGEEIIVCGLAHLKVYRNHPLYSDIVEYQKKRHKRIKKLNQMR